MPEETAATALRRASGAELRVPSNLLRASRYGCARRIAWPFDAEGVVALAVAVDFESDPARKSRRRDGCT